MLTVLRDAAVYENGAIRKRNLLFDGVEVSSFSETALTGISVSYVDHALVLPGFCDVHVHFREPGFSYKEDIASGTAAAARGGYTAVCTMPNLSPAPDNAEHLKIETDAISRFARIAVYPYGTITKEEHGCELSDMEALSASVIAFSDDGHGVQSDDIMESAMRKAKSLGKIIAAHCEDNSLLHGGYIHDGIYAREHGHRGISSESEWRQIERDLMLAQKTGCAYHVCHISTAESVALIRSAKAAGVDVTCETAPHYLVLDERNLEEDGRFKMNPPLRSPRDREALLEGISDGTIDMIATDHAPHSAEEKARGLEKSAMGIVGLETAFPVLYTKLVKKNVISLERLVMLMSVSPRRRFGIPSDPGFCIYDISHEYEICPDDFLSRGRSTPFAGMRVFGKCLATVYGGKTVWQSK